MTTDDTPEPSSWDDVTSYLAQMHNAWQWGYCDRALQRRVRHLFAERAAGRGGDGTLDELLMAWQVLHGFPLEYRLPIGV
ncbi:hypothetical protein LQ327_05095 [Actinomycetospora endophytica]|uniref:Uncharacterized protein n=1 Tax=Actinomycetospora endophytica TaxID=2291215 RepID=A0ABS8P3D2_9PSEU|nr:hypothetical protein [Actinomycetospora endophytica]MCD2192762.1 hypothetical protein [Actinomycetospora endophytica]